MLPVITEWVKMAWESIITTSFKKCSINNDLDGMEDDVLWAKQHEKSDTHCDEEGDKIMMTHEQIELMFSEERDDDTQVCTVFKL